MGAQLIWMLSCWTIAKRDPLYFPEADDTFEFKNRLNFVKLYGQHCNMQGKPITGWRQVMWEEFNAFRCSDDYNHILKELTIHPSFQVDSPMLIETPFKQQQVAINMEPTTSSGSAEDV